jgi:FAD/FMN-containing dehydrogenase
VALGLAGVLAACSGGSPVPTPTRTRTPGTSGTTTPAASAPPTGAGPDSWDALAAATTGALLRSGTRGWDAARKLKNARYDDADPQGILRVANTDDVVAGLAFARNTHTPIALRSGGHSYTGWSAGGAAGTDVPPSLVISTAELDDVRVSGESVTIGPGAQLADVYAALAKAGRAIGSGTGPTVGIGGLTLGGGVGVLVRSFGLTSDQLTGATIVTADGTVHEVSSSRDPDLFWACRGGGGGTAGVVTSLTFRTQPAPPVLLFGITFPWSAAAAVVRAWQDWAPTADRKLWSTLKLLGGKRHPEGPSVTVSGVWTGAKSGADASVDGFIAATGATPTRHTADELTYGQAMQRLAGTPVRVSEAATSSIGTTALTDTQIAALVQQAQRSGSVTGMEEGGVSLDALGGAVSDIGQTDTPFPWRSALCTVQYTAVFADGTDPAPFDQYVRDFRSAMRPAWGDGAYANYCDAAITDPSAYFDVNTSRLHRIAEQADPDGLFAQPHWV